MHDVHNLHTTQHQISTTVWWPERHNLLHSVEAWPVGHTTTEQCMKVFISFPISQSIPVSELHHVNCHSFLWDFRGKTETGISVYDTEL